MSSFLYRSHLTENSSTSSTNSSMRHTPVLKACYDLEAKARYHELLRNNEINASLRHYASKSLPYSSSTPLTSRRADLNVEGKSRSSLSIYSTLREWRQLRRSTSSSLGSGIFSPTSPIDGTKMFYDSAKRSLERLSRSSQFLSKHESEVVQRPSVSSTPEVILLDSEENVPPISDDRKHRRQLHSSRSSAETYTKLGDLTILTKAFEADPGKLCQKVRTEFNESRQNLLKKAKDLTYEAKLRRTARLAQQKNFEDEIRFRMRFEGLILAEPEEEEEPFVALSDEQLARVNKALEAGSADDVLVEGFNVQIKRSDIRTLAGTNWLNDEIMNFYFNLMMDRGGKNGLPSVYVFNTFFYPKLCQGGHAALKRWTRKVDIFSYNLILIPIHLGVHWCLAVIDFRNNQINYYDSMSGQNENCVAALKKYLVDERLEKKKEKMDIGSWQANFPRKIPQQMNGSDCGVFACRFAEYVSRDAEFNFTQDNMPYFRKRMVLEILLKTLL